MENLHHTKLFQLLHTLSVYELNRAGKFLRSPYFNEDAKLYQLFDVLAPHFKQQTQHTLQQKEIWKKLYGSKKFVPLKFARTFSDLLKKLEEFLVIDKVKQSEATRQQQLLNRLVERKLARHYPESAKLARAKLQATTHRDGDYYLHLFEVESQHNNFLELQNQRSTEKNLLQTIEALDAFYLINKLNYLAAILHYKNFLSLEGEVALMHEVLKHLKNKSYEHIPAIAIRYRMVLSLMEPQQEEHFKELKNKLADHYTLFDKSSARNMYAFAINYCIRKINFGMLQYVQELLGLYRQMLKTGLMMDENNFISQFDYKNIVTVGLRAGDTKWTEKFIRDYKNNIPKAERQNAYTFNLAKLYFYQKKFGEVLPLLQDVVYSDIFYQLDSKTTLIKTYYELGDYLPLMSLKESFRILLRRKKIISEQNRINYMNFLRFTMKLYRADVKDKNKIAALSKQITESTNVADKGWLLEKMREING
ncbi:MAG TPA: hypothetical protein VK174_09125 [Chitinophagales bacterium]|nr:hypothetical protein [Chitinophagales bacterium]